jgi:putative DNA topoisomerase
MSRIDHSLFDGQEGHQEQPDCPKCGSKLTIKNGKSGPFLGCTNYPQCTFIQSLTDSSVEVVKTMDDSHCPLCNSTLQIKKGRFGLFIGCSAYPDCSYIANKKENTDTQITCPSCKEGHLVEKTNRYGKRFFSCTRYPDCRYVVNFAPVAKTCLDCGWPILIKKAGKLQCPQKTCRYSEHDQSS